MRTPLVLARHTNTLPLPPAHTQCDSSDTRVLVTSANAFQETLVGQLACKLKVCAWAAGRSGLLGAGLMLFPLTRNSVM